MRAKRVIGQMDPFVPLDRIVDRGIHAGCGSRTPFSLAGSVSECVGKGPTLHEAENIE